MTISWFKSDGKLTVKEAVKVLYPKAGQRFIDQRPEDRSRFSQLLLEHGEKHLQDWAVIAYSSPFRESPNAGSTSGAAVKPLKTQWEQAPSRASQHRKRSISKKKPEIDLDAYPTVHMTKIDGRLHLCSRSIVFEPLEQTRGIVRCPFRKMEEAPREFPSDAQATGRFEPMCIEFRSSRHLVMKENKITGPFTAVALPTQFRFSFLHSSPGPFVELCQELFRLLKDKDHEEAGMALDILLRPMIERPFDLNNLVDVRERPLSSYLRCSLMSPLQSRPGCFVITTERIYFQPASGALSPTETKAMHWLTNHVVATACRYKGLRDTALEVYFRDSTSVLFAFERKRDQEQALRFLPRSALCFTDRDFLVAAIQEWQRGGISNYDYLLALNSAAGRTFNDLSRYPVFPWVIRDYESPKLDLNSESTYRDLSKPVGALNKKRLDYFKTRMAGMQDMDDCFLYGTHYSTPGYVLYYLVRSMPEHMLCLQNGKFDAPDRMFHGIHHCHSCVLSNHADVKELIPEFFNGSNDFDFLINAKGLQLGATQTGERVNDVILPHWAKSPRDFLKKNRKALESEICTRMLPQWIDLIFGCKSRGESAKESDNLFHSCCYLGPAELATMQNEHDRFQAELQATEFGLVPDKLFSGPHQLRHDAFNGSCISSEMVLTLSRDESGVGKGEAWELLDPPSNSSTDDLKSRLENFSSTREDFDQLLNKRSGTDNSLSDMSAKKSVSQSQSGESNNPFSNNDQRSNFPLSGSGDDKDRHASGVAAFASPETKRSFDKVTPPGRIDSPEKVATPTIKGGKPSDWDMKMLERRQIHSDAVSGCELCLDDGQRQLLTTTSLDGGLMAHKISLSHIGDDEHSRKGFTGTLSRFSYMTISRGQVTPSQSRLEEYQKHSARDPLACLVLAGDGVGGQVAFAGGHDDVVLAYGINSACAVASVYSHRDAVTGLALISRSPATLDSALWLENSTHVMVSGSWDATVKVWSVTIARGETVCVNREPIAELFDADSSVVSVAAISSSNGGLVISAGCADGSFCVWNLHSDGVKVIIHNEPAQRGLGPCTVVKFCSEAGRICLFTSFSTGKVASYTVDDGVLRRESAVSFGVAVNCLVYSEGILLVGCADGALRLIPVKNGTQFEAKPSMWVEVNGKASPGLSSICIRYTNNLHDGIGRCICCTGAEDGSVAIFELKKIAAPIYQS